MLQITSVHRKLLNNQSITLSTDIISILPITHSLRGKKPPSWISLHRYDMHNVCEKKIKTSYKKVVNLHMNMSKFKNMLMMFLDKYTTVPLEFFPKEKLSRSHFTLKFYSV
jgi:hypothetical protein